MGKPWTPDEDALLLLSKKMGKPHCDIAALLGRPLTSISSRLKTIKLVPESADGSLEIPARRAWTPEEDAELARCREARFSYASIATALGRTSKSVQQRAFELGITEPRDTKPEPSKRPTPTTRPCMCCRRDFKSEGPHHRLCTTCRRIETHPYHH